MLSPVNTREPINPRYLPLWKNWRIDNERALIGESLCWSNIQRGLVGPALRGRGERDKFFNRLKNGQWWSRSPKVVCWEGYSVVVGGTALLRTRPNGIAIFPGVCAGFTPVVQVLSRLNQPNFQLYVENIIFPAAHQHTVIITLYNNLYETLARHSTIISVNSCQICKILCYLEKFLSCVR